MLDVTVVLLDDGLSSTAIVPAEIFHSAGALWHDIHGSPAEPAFRVRTVSLSGGPVRSPSGLSVVPGGSIDAVEPVARARAAGPPRLILMGTEFRP